MISVVGILGDRPPASALGRIKEADLVVGSLRHLKTIADYVDGIRTLELGEDLKPALEALAGCEGSAVVLASGDPGFFGILRVLSERFGPERIEVFPDVSSIAAAFARVGLPWEDALVVSAHGRDPRRAVNACKAHPKVAVLTSPEFGPAELAEKLAGFGRRLVVAEKLGYPDERVVQDGPEGVRAEKWRDPNVVLVLDPERAVSPKGWCRPIVHPASRWALPEEAFEHRGGMITKAEVRAFALARLAPSIGDLIWDIGSGCGSVAIECAGLGAAVAAIEKDPEACASIRRNAQIHRVEVEIVCAPAPEALAGLDDPDAVFVGGTGGAFEEIVEVAARRALRSVVVSLACIERVSTAAKILAGEGLKVETHLISASRLTPTGPGRRLVPLNPVFLVCGARP